MGQYISVDVLNVCIEHIHYTNRPVCLLLNKQIHNLYLHSKFMIEDIKTFQMLDIILENNDFFKVILGPKYKQYITQENHHNIASLYEFAFKQRTIHTVSSILGLINVMIVPSIFADAKIRENHYNYNIMNMFSIIAIKQNFHTTDTSFLNIFKNYCKKFIYENCMFLQLSKQQIAQMEYRNYSIYTITELHKPEFTSIEIPDNCYICNILGNYFQRLTKQDQQIYRKYYVGTIFDTNISSQTYWNLFVETLSDSNIKNSTILLEKYKYLNNF